MEMKQIKDPNSSLSSDRLILSVAANLKQEIERFYPKDAKAISMARELVYYLSFKLSEKEKLKGDTNAKA